MIGIKKGFTLIEVLVSMAIASILLSFQCIIFVKYFNVNSRETKYIRDKNYYYESFVIMENLIYDEMIEVNVQNNEINIICKNNENKRIRFAKTSEKILVDYYDRYGVIKTSNVLGTKIRNMEVNKKDNIIYISLINKEGEKVSRCFGVKKFY